MTAADTSLTATADRLTRAADKAERLAKAATPGSWLYGGPTQDGAEHWLYAGSGSDRSVLCHLGDDDKSRSNAAFIAAFDPCTVAALVPLLRLFAYLAADLDERALSVYEGTTLAHLDTVARRLLGEEEDSNA